MTPQQPAKKQGANTDKAKALSDAFQKLELSTFAKAKVFYNYTK